MRIDPRPNLGDGPLDEVGRRPCRAGPRDANDEIAQDVATAGGVDDLGVELDPVEIARLVDQSGERRRERSPPPAAR